VLGAAGTAAAAFPAAPALADDKGGADIATLTGSLAVVQTAVVAYEAIANGGLLRGAAERDIRSFLEQERAHADILTKTLTDKGAPEPATPRRGDIRGLESLRSGPQALSFAIGLERREVATFYRASRELADANALKMLASIMACDGQHLVVLRQLTGRPAVPRAFETGAA
jgi:hypothetical protein